ncbi:zig-9 [Pristionchus pacificus]|uniref:Zig-9 n=1 Tax=Pristionchus pacificus TaxID=54126 RepID=A0A2A6BQI5_PRIPA|nr:zig-9 [Pristionchus pacificus]|eukprot:PDM68053.1 zig-9 [Pristionchus pacificus]
MQQSFPLSMIRIILISLVISLATADESSSCTSPCSKTSLPQCGMWLNSERMTEAAGIYELGEGIMNVSCSFSSLPRPSIISWLHRPSPSSSWIPFTCSTKDENISCSTTSEQKVSSLCILRTSLLNMTGSYKCEASTLNDDSKASSSEVSISVVGIESVQIAEKSLRPGHSGFVEVKVCANPQPEIWWSTSEGLLKPGQTLSNFASSHLAKSTVKTLPNGPASPIPYCYQARLVVATVNKGDSLSVMVRSHGGITTTLISSFSLSVYPALSYILITYFMKL